MNRPPPELPAPPPLRVPVDLVERLAKIGVTLDAAPLAVIGDYLARLIAANAVMNLTRITDPDDAWSRHALDALSLLPHLADLPAGARVVDVGSGGGVPGLPIAIARPDLRVALVEATAKKAAFLDATAVALGLRNVEVFPERAEKLTAGPLRARFDVVTARAVAPVDKLVAWTAPFARSGGRLLYIKGAKADEELAAARGALGRAGCIHERTVLTPTGRVVVLRRT